MYIITLANGKKLENLQLNGTNFVSSIPVDETIFAGNLSTMTVSDGEHEEIYHDMVFVQQMEFHGEYYLAFQEKSAQEKALERLENMETTTDDIILMMADLIGGE